jgi:hypothetical protein
MRKNILLLTLEALTSRCYQHWQHRLFGAYNTVKRVDEVVRHPHLVTQDQNTQVSNKVSDIHVENSIINIELFQHFSQVIELVRYDYISHVELIVCKCRTSSTELEFSKAACTAWARTCNLHIHNLVLRLCHTFFLV